MDNQGQEIYFIIIIGGLLALLLVGFIVTILFTYQRRQHQQEQELTRLKDLYEQEALRSQLEIQEETFKMLSQELHDNIGQSLSVVKLSLAILPVDKQHEAWEPIQNARDILNKAVLDLAGLNKSLHTDRIAQIGLVEAISFEVESLRKSRLVDVAFAVNGYEQLLDEQKSVMLFRIFQEMLNNTLKHSQASRIEISLSFTEDNQFILLLADNGVGFDIDAKRNSVSSSSGVGLKSIFNRAKLVGADIDMHSEIGKGTTTTIKMMLPPESESDNHDR
ncbi:sensor histidine kinase [Pseudoflavitalea sp. G-6-1-2]|uniref:sensor histidine kinase n=1 Tax=Pseudoflavitalea sp. G-6-1-2 TaxID=2728841 RepID=UPI00146AC192|nr:ATP-binding protein [Pseudoflavitalea sp. G-6-1-2]NML20352.1 sensor histidine kinase [Pseudoflavitalea sp. G-6-1-2]